MWIKISPILFMLVSMLTVGQAQITISGLVASDSGGEALAGASILDKNTGAGTYTDADGRFELSIAQDDALLLIEYLGYEAQEIPVSTSTELTIRLKDANTVLGEVVITALGLERSSRKLGYAVQQLDGNALSEVQSTNMVQNLAGKLAGVTVSQGATGVGSTSKIVIRGESSFTNNNPLFVVDGTPINNNSILNFTNEAAAGFQEVDFGNGAMDINPEDIANISVLKGPSAAALYGTRASNGVVLITTKTGKEAEGFGVNFSSSFSVETPFTLPDFQNKYGQGNSGAFEFVDGLGGGVNDNITYSWGPALDQGILIPQFDSPVTLSNGNIVRGGDVAVHGGATIPATPFVSYPDNLSDFYETGHTLTNYLSISNTTQRGDFRLSFADMRNNAIIPGVNLNRNNIAGRFQFRPTDKWTINSSINYIYTRSDNRPASGYGSENVNYSLVAWGPRSLNTEALKDYWQPGLEEIQQYSFNYTFFDNPYFILLENRNAFDRNRVFGNLSVQYQLNEHWSIMARTGLDLSDEQRTFRRHFSSNRFRRGAYAEHNVRYREQNSDILINFNKSWAGFRLDLSAGANRLDQRADSRQQQTLALAQAGIFSFTNAAAPIEAFALDSEKRINSLYGIAKLEFSNWLFLELTGRNDWSSALATATSADQASFFYPSVSLSTALSELVELPAVVSYAQLRASWAQVGNDTDPYQTSTVFIGQTPYNAQPTFTAQDIIANNNLQPEKTEAIEFGADLRFWDDRLRFDVSYYDATTSNQIIALPVTVSSGYTQQVVNGGEVRSRGVEILAGLTPVRRKNFSWESFINFSRNVATVESLPDAIEGRLTLAYSRVYDNVNQTVWLQVDEGGQIGDLYGTGYLKNENGDFVIGNDGRFIVDNNLIKLGNYNPDFIVGFSNRFQYKQWGLNFLVDWRQGGVLVSRTLALAAVGGQLIETENRPENGIVAEGVVNVGTTDSPEWQPNTTPISAEAYYRQFYDRNHEENNTYDASYIKLRELSLSYRFKPKGALQGLQLSLIGRNLFAISEIPHFDPEQLAVQGTGFLSGVEDMSYATSRSIGIKVGIQL